MSSFTKVITVVLLSIGSLSLGMEEPPILSVDSFYEINPEQISYTWQKNKDNRWEKVATTEHYPYEYYDSIEQCKKLEKQYNACQKQNAHKVAAIIPTQPKEQTTQLDIEPILAELDEIAETCVRKKQNSHKAATVMISTQHKRALEKKRDTFAQNKTDKPYCSPQIPRPDLNKNRRHSFDF